MSMKKSSSLEVIELKEESKDCISIILKKPTEFSYQAGDCLDISFSDALQLGKQTYSFASTPQEEEIILTFKKGYSEFKHRLEKLLPGDHIEVLQYGSNFIFDPSRQSVMIAGGVGITPLRSMIKTRLDSKPYVPTVLIYLNKTSDFPFYKELSSWEKKFLSLSIYWIPTDQEGRLTTDKFLKLVGSPVEFDYYAAGPPLMVDAITEILEGLEIDPEQIHTDSFDGYLEEI